MNALLSLLHSSWIPVVGAALIQFLWQAALVAVLLLAGQPWLRRHSANARYLAGCLALVALPLAFAGTLFRLASTGGGATGAGWLAATPAFTLKAAPWLVGIWAAGMICCGAYALAGWAWAQRIRHGVEGSAAEVPQGWRAELAQLAARLGVGRRVQLARSSRVSGPCTLGWLRPVILLPLNAFESLPGAQLRALLAHELAHIRRHDYLVNLAQRALEVIFFFHPAVWWLSRQVSESRELCCDDLAIAGCGDRAAYARALVELAAWQSEHATAHEPAQALAAGGGALGARISRLLGRPAEGGSRRGWRMSVGMALVAACGLWLLSASAQWVAPAAAPAVPTAPAPPAAPRARKAPQAPAPPLPPLPPRSRVPAPPPPPPPHPGQTTVVAFSLTAFPVCSPQPVWMPEILPSGAAIMRLQMVMRCVPIFRPVEVLVLTSI
ncbi:MAG: M56 family metallopeptidase [Terriglobales bacterium]